MQTCFFSTHFFHAEQERTAPTSYEDFIRWSIDTAKIVKMWWRSMGMNGLTFELLYTLFFIRYSWIWMPLLNPYAAGWQTWPIQNNAKILKNHWNPGKWVLIWEYSARAFQWVPTWQGLDVFQRYLCCWALDISSLSIGRVNYTNPYYKIPAMTWHLQGKSSPCLPLPMLRLLSSKTQGRKDFWKPPKPCHVGIH